MHSPGNSDTSGDEVLARELYRAEREEAVSRKKRDTEVVKSDEALARSRAEVDNKTSEDSPAEWHVIQKNNRSYAQVASASTVPSRKVSDVSSVPLHGNIYQNARTKIGENARKFKSKRAGLGRILDEKAAVADKLEGARKNLKLLDDQHRKLDDSATKEEAVVNQARKNREATTSKYVVKAKILPKRLDPYRLEQHQQGVAKGKSGGSTNGHRVGRHPTVQMAPVQPHHNTNPDTIEMRGVSITIEDFRFLQRTCPRGVSLLVE